MNEWSQHVLAPILNNQLPDEIKVRNLGGLALLSADTDKIKDYVFESARLPEIRGASMILDELNQGWPGGKPNIRSIFAAKGLPTGSKDDPHELSCIVYAGGGSLLALVPYHFAEELRAEIEALYPRQTGVATITCVYQPLTAREVLERFDKLMACQSLLLRLAKYEKDPLPFFEAIPPVRRCQSCGLRPAACYEAEPAPRWLCWPCKKKVDQSKMRGGKKQWTLDFVDELLAGRLDCNPQYYLNGYEPTEQALEAVQGAKDLDEIALASRDEKSIGFIYADGNGVGQLVEQSKTVDEYRRKSDVLHQAIRHAVFTALARHLQIKRGIHREIGRSAVDIHPFEIITVGGDDALLIVPSDRALDVATTLGRTFEGMLAESGEFKRATLSVGLVVADPHNPVYFLRALAEDLLKSAKKRARQLAASGQTPAEGTLDFMALKSQTMLSTDLSDLRAHFPWTITSLAPQREKAILTGRPFTWTEVERLKRTAQAVDRALPRTQLQALRRALREGRLASTLFYLYQWARADDWRKILLRWVEQEWGIQPVQVPPPWISLGRKRDYDRYWTVWEDIFEARELVPRLKDEEWQALRDQIQQQMESEVAHAG